MAYPFTEAPTVADFIEKAIDEYGAKLKETKGKVTGPRGAVTIRFLFLPLKPTKYTEPLPNDNQERLAPDTLRRLCKQLGIPVKAFGLNLG